MTDRPMIFSAPMIQALLAGRKTQTRRLVRFPGWAAGIFTNPLKVEVETDERGHQPEVICENTGCLAALPLPYAVGDRLWVRETHQFAMSGDGPCVLMRATGSRWSPDWTGPDEGAGPSYDYDRCPGDYSRWAVDLESNDGPWRSPIHMPRWASRLTLVVTDVRVGRLNDISEDDARDEGVEPICDHGVGNTDLHSIAYAQLWDRLHGEGAWRLNPWVAAINFRVHQANIDALLAGALDIERAA